MNPYQITALTPSGMMLTYVIRPFGIDTPEQWGLSAMTWGSLTLRNLEARGFYDLNFREFDE